MLAADPYIEAIEPLEAGSLTVGLAVDRLVAAQAAGGDDPVTLMVLAAVSIGNAEGFDDDLRLLTDWSAADRPAPDSMRTPVSGYSVALWLGFSRETVRRKLTRLVARGLVVWSGHGYLVPAEVMTRPAFQEGARAAFTLCATYFQAMERLGLVSPDLSAMARREAPKARMAGRALNAFGISVLEAMGRLTHGELKQTLLLCAIFRRWSGLRLAPRGPTAVALAAELGLSRETARRHIRLLEQAGLVEERGGGLRLSAALLQSQPLQIALQKALEGRAPFLERIARAGVLAPAP